jgi:hypothetical protein
MPKTIAILTNGGDSSPLARWRATSFDDLEDVFLL